LGRSRGGLSTKIHAAGDALGNPVRLIGGPGQQHDMSRACELVDGLQAKATIGDKGYDANRLEAKIIQQGSQLVIPPKRTAKRRAPTIKTSTRNAISSSASSTSSNNSAASRQDMTNCSSISWASSNSQRLPYGSNS
jgi:putative transposase